MSTRMEADVSRGDAGSETSLPKRVLVALMLLATLGLGGVWLVAWIPTWPCTLFEHFRVQYVVIGVLLLVACAALRLRRCVDAIAIVTLLHALPIAADLTASRRSAPAGGAPVRILLANVWTEGEGFAKVRQLIADEKPDLIGLVEVDRRWLRELAPALGGYAGRIEEPREDNFGIALYARGPLSGTVEPLGSPLPSVIAEVLVDGVRLRVLVTHPLPPVDSEAYRQQERQLDAVAERARAATDSDVVMGDFNATPWSRPFVRLLHRTGLCDSRAGFGVQASFPSGRAALRIPIDHLLASCSIGVGDRRIGPDIGSDHLPVIADLVIPR
jgi:endonuclease/exonuclease/phosphatase (EEP) superfamily protein YafD